MRYLWFTLIGLAVFAALSVLAAYMYGRFAERARGEASWVLKRQDDATLLDRRFGPLVSEHVGESGLVMLSSNLDAFAVRALSARAAGRSLDLMYYIWKDDLTGGLLLNEVLEAADRGVRVRLLLDDIGVKNNDGTFLALASHPNIELRLFNPTRARKSSLRRGVEMALRAFSVTRRMHNKAWIVDGRVLIAGGRNIGDEYFDAAETSTFRDLDLLALGKVVGEAEAMFDDYWNSGLALPIDALGHADGTSLASLGEALRHLAAGEAARPYLDRVRERLSLVALVADSPLHWTASARLLSDPPEKAAGKDGDNWLMSQVIPILASAKEKLDVTSPYFIPGDDGTSQLVALSGRGVDVRVLTNSLAATDVAAVHGGYAPYRTPLLEGGVKLFELRPTAGPTDMSLRGSSSASLHTKAFTVDDGTGFIGSLNFDPRSSSLNTEMGIVFEEPALVSAMQALFADEISPEASYAVTRAGDGSLRWTARIDGETVAYNSEPEAGFVRRVTAWLVGLLPIESQL